MAHQSSAGVGTLFHSRSRLGLQGTCAWLWYCWLWLLLSGWPESQPGTVVTRQCSSGGIVPPLLESKETLCFCLLGMLIFSPSLKTKLPETISYEYTPSTFKLNPAFKKNDISLPYNLRFLCMELTDGGHGWWMHLDAHRTQLTEHPRATGWPES